jgi:glycosyltransferase involved in cell wall biosynthesis
MTSRAKQVIVIAGQTPPPTGGQNVMIAQLLEDLQRGNFWCVEHLKFCFTPSFASVRQARFFKLWELLKVYGRLARLVYRHGRVDLVIYPSGGPQTVPMVRDIMLLPFVRLATKRLWVQFHAAGIADRLKKKYGTLEALLKAVYGPVDGAIVMTNFNRCDPESLGIERVKVIPHQLKDENPEGRLPDYTKRPLRILHAGHLYDQKGTPQLVEAFGKLAPAFPDWRLVLMGEFLPPYSEKLCRARCRELGLEDRVEITGVLRGAKKAEQFRAAHVFVFASIAPYESFGLVMVEAMMWGLPLVVTDWRGNRDLAGDTARYVQVDGNLAERLTDALRKILGDEINRWPSVAAQSRQSFEVLYARTGFGSSVAKFTENLLRGYAR